MFLATKPALMLGLTPRVNCIGAISAGMVQSFQNPMGLQLQEAS